MTDVLTFEPTILAASGQRFLCQFRIASATVLVMGGVAAWNEARVLALRRLPWLTTLRSTRRNSSLGRKNFLSHHLFSAA
jgi:hypothetical protein